MSLSYNGYSRLAASTASVLTSAYNTLNRTTNSLLASLDILRGRTTPTIISIDDLVAEDVADISDAIATATETIGRNQAADAALATVHNKLEAMRDLVQDVALGTLTEAEVAGKDAEYQTLADEVSALLEDTVYEAVPVLSGADAVTALSLSDITGMSLTDLPDGALGDIGTAITDAGLARTELATDVSQRTATVAALEAQSAQLADLSARVTTAQEALGMLRSTTRLIWTQMNAALAAQGAYLSSRIENLVGVNFLG